MRSSMPPIYFGPGQRIVLSKSKARALLLKGDGFDQCPCGETREPIYVQPNQSASHISARIEAITPGMDLAILKLDDENFFDKRGSLPFAQELPRVKDNINVYGYPTGGTELSVTQGIVSRIEFTDYYYQSTGLRIQVDAALNFGNSGGPAVTDGKLIGLVFSLIQNAAEHRLSDSRRGDSTFSHRDQRRRVRR